MWVFKSYRSNVFVLTALILSKIGVDTTAGLRGILGGGKGGGGSRGIKGFLPGFNFASGNSGGQHGGRGSFQNATVPVSEEPKQVGLTGKGIFGGGGGGKGIFGGGGGGKGIFGGGGGGKGIFGGGGGGKGIFGGGGNGKGLFGKLPRLPGLGGSGGAGKGILGGALKLPKLPSFGGGGSLLGGKGFGGGGSSSEGGRKPSGVFSKLNQNLPCASGIGSLPIISRIPGIPSLRFPSFIPSGVNTCDATCGGKDSNSCTYNWRDSLLGFPFLLFHCFCNNPGQCPPKKLKFGGYLNIGCENVSGERSRCKCPYGEDPYKCTINILPIFQRKNSYYCACCKGTPEGEALGGYGGGEASNQEGGGYSYPSASNSDPEFQGGYSESASSTNFEGGGYSAASSSIQDEVEGGYQGSSSSLEGASLVNDKPTFAQGKPLGSDQFLYGHLR